MLIILPHIIQRYDKTCLPMLDDQCWSNVYSWLIRLIITKMGETDKPAKKGRSFTSSFISGGIAGVVAKTIIAPI